MKITAIIFAIYTGANPERDDLQQANCPDEGKLGHYGCGWNHEANKPQWMEPTPERIKLISGKK